MILYSCYLLENAQVLEEKKYRVNYVEVVMVFYAPDTILHIRLGTSLLVATQHHIRHSSLLRRLRPHRGYSLKPKGQNVLKLIHFPVTFPYFTWLTNNVLGLCVFGTLSWPSLMCHVQIVYQVQCWMVFSLFNYQWLWRSKDE